jgi:hypothetical protein
MTKKQQSILGLCISVLFFASLCSFSGLLWHLTIATHLSPADLATVAKGSIFQFLPSYSIWAELHNSFVVLFDFVVFLSLLSFMFFTFWTIYNFTHD